MKSDLHNKPLPNTATASVRGQKEIALAAWPVEQYKPFLFKIAISFGLNEEEARSLVQQVCDAVPAFNADREPSLSLKMALSKSLVHQCIFKISIELFSYAGDTLKERPSPLPGYFNYHNTKEVSLQKMPLDLRAVYLLRFTIGFAEHEIAKILNSSVQRVKQKLFKACLFMQDCQQPGG